MRWQPSPDGGKVTASEILEHRTDLVSDPTTGAVLGDNFYFIANARIYNLEVFDYDAKQPLDIYPRALQDRYDWLVKYIERRVSF